MTLDPTPARRTVAHRRTTAARSRGHVQHGIELGESDAATEMLVRRLVRAQLRLGITVLLVTAVPLAALPALFAVAPAIGRAKVLGAGIPWVVLGLASYPMFALVGWWYVRRAERSESEVVAEIERERSTVPP
jgi:hypothetical protein